jgi:hypothetical protein
LAFKLKNISKKSGIDDIRVYAEYNELDYYIDENMNTKNYKQAASHFPTSDIVLLNYKIYRQTNKCFEMESR